MFDGKENGLLLDFVYSGSKIYSANKSPIMYIKSSMSTLLCLIMFVHGVTGEVGTKEFPRDLEDPLFVYHYGFSFFFLVLSYLSTELGAVFVLIVFMAKQEERMCRDYHVHPLFTFMKNIVHIQLKELESNLRI
uniref:Uncharacterized protein n=1 Tax=Romanomermis culicivorax TaxID=13658 RepID=A0A915J256_ROMCU